MRGNSYPPTPLDQTKVAKDLIHGRFKLIVRFLSVLQLLAAICLSSVYKTSFADGQALLPRERIRYIINIWTSCGEWKDAAADCQHDNASLAMLSDNGQQQFVLSWLPTNKSYWIGRSDTSNSMSQIGHVCQYLLKAKPVTLNRVNYWSYAK